LTGRGAWLLLAAALAAGACVGATLPAPWLAWMPSHAVSEPWRWWSAAFVHFSRSHLLANLGGLALVAALGWLANVSPRIACAWLLAWPLTHLGLLLRPDLLRYGGLSGVLHAGIAAAAWHLARRHTGRHRAVGFALLAGLAAKLLVEAPWGPALRHSADWDIAIAPLAHATGAVAGLLCALLLDRTRPEGPLHR